MGGDKAMLRRSIGATMAAAMTVACTLAGAEESLPALVKRVEPSVLLVQTYADSGKKLAQGSGFFISSEGDVVTNRHVLLGADRAQVRTASGAIYAVHAIVAEDRVRDLVRLSLDIPDGTAVPLQVADKLPEAGERVLVIGSPQGLEQTATDGIVSAVRSLPPLGEVIQISAPISPGSSGSPVVNLAGQVVGVASMLRQDGQNLNFAVSARALVKLQRGPGRPLSSLKEARRPVTTSAEQAYLTGVSYLTQRNYSKALPFFEAAVRERPTYAEAYFHIGACLEGLGREKEAGDAYQSAALLKPEAADFHVRLGGALEKLGRLPEAYESFMQAVRLSPDSTSALLGVARCYNAMGRPQDAAAACQQAIRAHSSPEAYLALGDSFLKGEKYAAATEAYKQAVRLDPEEWEAHSGMGMALYRMGRSSEATESFKLAVRLEPDAPGPHYGLGLCAVALGNRGMALQEYKVLKELDPALAEDLFAAIY